MNVWEELAERKLVDRVTETPEGRAFAHLFGMVEGYGRSLLDMDAGLAGDMIMVIVSESLAALLGGAIDYYEKQLEEQDDRDE